jgi:hypothetical protein
VLANGGGHLRDDRTSRLRASLRSPELNDTHQSQVGEEIESVGVALRELADQQHALYTPRIHLPGGHGMGSA